MTTEAEVTKTNQTHWFKQPGCVVAVVVAVMLALVVVGGVYSLVKGARNAMAAEERLHAMKIACDLVAQSVERSGGKSWPANWEELESLTVSEPMRWMYAWPREAEQVRARVEIDFSLTVDQVLKQQVRSFTALKPIGKPNFPMSPEFGELQDRLRNARKSSTP